jgi:H+/Cl- antiporter ClcA
MSRLRRPFMAVRAALEGGWAAVRDIDPDFWRNLHDEVVAGRQWFDRALVLAFAAVTGAVVVGFTLLAEAASHGFDALRGAAHWAPFAALLWTPALTVVLLWWTRRLAPGAAGSGVPQVVRAVEGDLPPGQQAWLVVEGLAAQGRARLRRHAGGAVHRP